MIERTFQDIPEGKVGEADKQSFLVSLGWSRGTTWTDLLRSMRVLIISEAGAGKTYECRERARRLWDAGEPAFFVELTGLGQRDLRSLLGDEEESRLDAWLSSQSDFATFFLDSIDELRLTLGSFEQALKHLKKGIGGRLGQARIVITTRADSIRRTARVPACCQFLRRLRGNRASKPSQESRWAINPLHNSRTRTIAPRRIGERWGSLPLSDGQIIEFAKDQGVEGPQALLDDLEKRNAQEFARRPQDLIELCADWREHKRIRTHRDQVATNVRVKLLPRDDRPEPAELSVDKAIEGASRLGPRDNGHAPHDDPAQRGFRRNHG